MNIKEMFIEIFNNFILLEKILFSEGIFGGLLINSLCLGIVLCVFFQYNPLKLLNKKGDEYENT